MLRSVWLIWPLSLALITASTPYAWAASGCNPRVPPVAFNSAALQAFLAANDGGINVMTDQKDAQYFPISLPTYVTRQLNVILRFTTSTARVGIYSAPDPTGAPTLFQIFPDSSRAWWGAQCTFTSNGGLTVTLFDYLSMLIQGTVTYSGFSGTVAGWYLQNAGGTYYSQDARNGGSPQALLYAGTGINFYDTWECLEGAPYNAGTSTFTSAVLDVRDGYYQGPFIDPCVTPVRSSTWGSLKAIYR
jgi:hypothetical protein